MFKEKLSFVEKTLLTRHLAVMLKAGIPLTESLASLEGQSKSANTRNKLKEIREGINNGKSLTDALKSSGEFNDFYLGLVKVGETSGTLETSLQFLAEQLNKEYVLGNKIRGAMLYPSLVMLITLIMGGFISLFILPQLVDFFSAFDTELPLATKILLTVANFMKNYGVVFFAGLVGVILAMGVLVRNKKVKPYWHKFILSLPIMGSLAADGEIARFGRNLGILLKSGVPITEALTTTAQTLTYIPYKKEVERVKNSLVKGKELAETIRELKIKLFPQLVTSMVSVGEKSGKLDETLNYLGDFYEEEIDVNVKNMTTLIEPVLLIAIGIIVAFTALAIISPIYDLMGNLK